MNKVLYYYNYYYYYYYYYYKLFVRRARESLGQNYCEGAKRKKKRRTFVGEADERRRREEFERVFSRKVAAASEVRVKGAEFLHL